MGRGEVLRGVLTQKQKILALMCKQPNKWFYPYEFMKPDLGDLYVGYKAPTRISEMHKYYPYLFNKKTDDKYMQRKLNMDNYSKWYPALDSELQAVVDEYLQMEIKAPEPPAKAISWADEYTFKKKR